MKRPSFAIYCKSPRARTNIPIKPFFYTSLNLSSRSGKSQCTCPFKQANKGVACVNEPRPIQRQRIPVRTFFELGSAPSPGRIFRPSNPTHAETSNSGRCDSIQLIYKPLSCLMRSSFLILRCCRYLIKLTSCATRISTLLIPVWRCQCRCHNA
jgi:hypothetical protein